MDSCVKAGDRVRLTDGSEGVVERLFDGGERFGPCADVQFDDGRWRQLQLSALQLVPSFGFGKRERFQS